MFHQKSVFSACAAFPLLLAACGSPEPDASEPSRQGVSVSVQSAQNPLNIPLDTATTLRLTWPVTPGWYGSRECSSVEVAVLDRSGRAVEIQSLRFEPFMKTMGHGTLPVRLKKSSDSAWKGPVFFSMPGRWEIEMDLTLATGRTHQLEVIYSDVPDSEGQRGAACSG